jgi:D-methionine transport system ATP-binding protein
VFDNIAFPLRYHGLGKAEIERRVRSLLELVELSDKARAYPSQLSGGQKQRIAIARALADNPKVLLCDEATSALDPRTTASILRLLRQVNKTFGITIVIITHEMGVIKEICDRVAVMDNGRVVESGEVFDLFADPRQEVTKTLLTATSAMERIYDLIAEDSPIVALKPGEKLLRLRYLRRSVSTPLISYLSRTYRLDLNILFGALEIIGDAPLGGLIVIADGAPEDMAAALAYLQEIHVGVEVIKDA